MNTAMILGYGMYFGGALVFAIILVLLLGIALAVTNRHGKFMLPMSLSILGLAVATSTILINRSLRYIDVSPEGVNVGVQYFVEGHYAAAGWSLRLMTLTVLAISAALVINYMFKRDKPASHGLLLFIGFLLFFVTNTVLSSILGTRPVFEDNHYHPLLLLMAAYATRNESPELLLKYVKYTVLALLLGSVLMAFIRFDLVVQSPYVYGWIPGLRIRLWGLLSHANSLGPLAVLYFVLEIYQPFRRRWLRYSSVLLTLGVLFLTQSKTAWVSAILIIAMVWLYRSMPMLRQAWRTGNPNTQVATVAMTFISGALALLFAMIYFDMAAVLDHFLSTTAGYQLQSLTGRDRIWEVAIEAWKASPLFGYGPKLWDPEFRKSIGLSFAFSAHNQFLQSLAGAGAVGIIGLVTYLVIIAYYALRLITPTNGLSLVLAVFLLLRCMTETPLATGNIITVEFMTHVLIFGYFVRVIYQLKSSQVASARVNVEERPIHRHGLAITPNMYIK